MPHSSLTEFFNSLSDEALLERIRSGLSDEALVIAHQELQARSLAFPAPEHALAVQETPYWGDMVILERNLTPTDAHLLTNCLRVAGIEAEAGDTTIVQMHSLMSLALGGAKVRVPQSQVPQARRVLQAFRRGELALDDDFDVDVPSA